MLTVLSLIRSSLTQQVAAAAPDVAVIPIDTDAELPSDVAGEVLLTYPWSSPHLAELMTRGVRWVHALGTGIDRFPLNLLGGRPFTCSRGGSAVPIAEWVLAVMLAFEKGLPEAWIHAPPAGGWSRGARGGTLYGRTLGLVGLGGIGTEVARLALPFGMRVQAHRRTGAPSSVEGVAIVGSLPDLVASSDHIVIAAPATPATHHVFNAELLARCKPESHLVNIARGALVDQDALRAALDAGCPAMASLDAVEPEPLPEGHWLYTHPRVRLSPHISWQMPGAVDMLLEPFLDNLHRYQSGRPLIGIVDPDAGY
jgi:phosphoglycerate dehydrogenase-like enzyme